MKLSEVNKMTLRQIAAFIHSTGFNLFEENKKKPFWFFYKKVYKYQLLGVMEK